MLSPDTSQTSSNSFTIFAQARKSPGAGGRCCPDSWRWAAETESHPDQHADTYGARYQQYRWRLGQGKAFSGLMLRIVTLVDLLWCQRTCRPVAEGHKRPRVSEQRWEPSREREERVDDASCVFWLTSS